MKKLAVVIMAAGKGTRMNNPDKAKVMYEIVGEPLISHVVKLAKNINADKIISIVGFKKEEVTEFLYLNFENILIAVQEPQLGTGHAVMQTENYLNDFGGDVLVLSGDVPLLKIETIEKLFKLHSETNSVATILTGKLKDPTGYGRIIRNSENNVIAIVEHKDANDEIKKINEINSGIYIFNSLELFKSLKNLKNNNAQKEYYLPDVFKDFFNLNMKISAMIIEDFNEVNGINTIEQLNETEKYFKRINKIN